MHSGAAKAGENADAAGLQDAAPFGKRVIVDIIEEQIVALLALGAVFFRVVDDVISAQLARHLHVPRAAHGGDLRIERFCDLNCERPNASRCAVNQDFLAGFDPSCAQPLERSQARESNRASLLEGNVGGLQSDAIFASAYVLRDRAPFYPKDFVARFEFSDIPTGRLDHTCEIAPETRELWLPQTGH